MSFHVGQFIPQTFGLALQRVNPTGMDLEVPYSRSEAVRKHYGSGVWQPLYKWFGSSQNGFQICSLSTTPPQTWGEGPAPHAQQDLDENLRPMTAPSGAGLDPSKEQFSPCTVMSAGDSVLDPNLIKPINVFDCLQQTLNRLLISTGIFICI